MSHGENDPLGCPRNIEIAQKGQQKIVISTYIF